MKAISNPDVRVPENTIPSHTAFRSQDFSAPVWLRTQTTETSKSTKRERHWTVFYYSQAKLILVSQGLVPAYQCRPSEGVGACSHCRLRGPPRCLESVSESRAVQPLTGASTFETCYLGFVFVL